MGSGAVDVASFEVDPPEVTTGELVIVEIVVDNPHESEEGTRTFMLSVDGTIIEKFTVTLAPEEERTLAFDILETEVGAHTVVLESEVVTFEDTFTVKD